MTVTFTIGLSELAMENASRCAKENERRRKMKNDMDGKTKDLMEILSAVAIAPPECSDCVAFLCERTNIPEWYQQSFRDAGENEIPIVVHKRNREPWMVTMSFEDFMKMYTASDYVEQWP